MPAPSQIPLAPAAVTTPSLSKTGRSLEMDSTVVSGLGCSSVSMVLGPLRVLTSMGAISASKCPAAYNKSSECGIKGYSLDGLRAYDSRTGNQGHHSSLND